MTVEQCDDAAFIDLIREYPSLGAHEYALKRAFATHRIAAEERQKERDAAGEWQRIGTFTPDPSTLYLVRGTLRTSIKRGDAFGADSLFAAAIREGKS
jgi:hypothetical protein